jgi:hypothetical protein
VIIEWRRIADGVYSGTYDGNHNISLCVRRTPTGWTSEINEVGPRRTPDPLAIGTYPTYKQAKEAVIAPAEARAAVFRAEKAEDIERQLAYRIEKAARQQ